LRRGGQIQLVVATPEVDYGMSKRLDGYATRAGADAVAWPAAGVAPGAPSRFLEPRRAGSL
jgi:hypothetical protein